MITIAITNVRGCARAQMECAPIALIAGLNGAGKTSIAQAVASALTGLATLVPGLPKGMTGALVHLGAERGIVEVCGDNGSASIEWPDARATLAGTAPSASEYATGMQSLALMPPKDRMRVLADYLHAEPTRDDLTAALTGTDLAHEVVIDAVWKLIEQHGWDGAERIRRDRGAEMKGQWRQVTGQHYGSRVAAAWRPDLAERRESDLVAAVKRAEAERDRAVSAEAVSDAERTRLATEADALTERQDRLRHAEVAVTEAEQTFARARGHRQSLPPAEQQRTMACPYCGEPIVVHQDLAEMRLEQATGKRIADTELKRRRLDIASADGALSNADAELTARRRALEQVRIDVHSAEAARDRIANWPRAVETGVDLEAAKAALSRAERDLAELKTKQQADELHAKIEGNDIVIGLLASDGLRARKLGLVVEVFNRTQLAGFSEAARWPPVAIDAGGNLTYGGRAYVLLSSSEQYRVRAVLAAAMAQLDGSSLVIFDGADILDAPSRGGLFALLDALGLPALVCMTLGRREQVPDLAASEMGRSYWLAGGVLEPLARVTEAA